MRLRRFIYGGRLMAGGFGRYGEQRGQARVRIGRQTGLAGRQTDEE